MIWWETARQGWLYVGQVKSIRQDGKRLYVDGFLAKERKTEEATKAFLDKCINATQLHSVRRDGKRLYVDGLLADECKTEAAAKAFLKKLVKVVGEEGKVIEK